MWCKLHKEINETRSFNLIHCNTRKINSVVGFATICSSYLRSALREGYFSTLKTDIRLLPTFGVCLQTIQYYSSGNNNIHFPTLLVVRQTYPPSASQSVRKYNVGFTDGAVSPTIVTSFFCLLWLLCSVRLKPQLRVVMIFHTYRTHKERWYVPMVQWWDDDWQRN
jgi:hypothetical protein